ncbi:MAG TPA: sulfate adenylyltransferase [Patescibacteria group bacterium]|nr:sulfate adenylyltransferase [Patescibacteria group bacterium]
MKRIKVAPAVLREAYNIFDGVYAPVSGFLKRSDLESVLFNMRLSEGGIWPIPIVLNISEREYRDLGDAEQISLTDERGKTRVVLDDVEVYEYDREIYVRQVFGTDSNDHPGVAAARQGGKYFLGGEVKWADPNRKNPARYFTPSQTRDLFRKKGWRTVVAFQTRNIPHRSHEFLQKQALKIADAVFIQPVIGKKKKGDFKDELILKGYESLLEKYYPQGRYYLASLPLQMRYAGPKEAVMHALIRRNFGCSHMIIGRDHAGVNGFYGPLEAQNIFDEFSSEELGIEILKFGEVKHCSACGGLNFASTCPHNGEDHISLSGTGIREMISRGQKLPEELVRPEISELLLNHPDPFV